MRPYEIDTLGSILGTAFRTYKQSQSEQALNEILKLLMATKQLPPSVPQPTIPSTLAPGISPEVPPAPMPFVATPQPTAAIAPPSGFPLAPQGMPMSVQEQHPLTQIISHPSWRRVDPATKVKLMDYALQMRPIQSPKEAAEIAKIQAETEKIRRVEIPVEKQSKMVYGVDNKGNLTQIGEVPAGSEIRTVEGKPEDETTPIVSFDPTTGELTQVGTVPKGTKIIEKPMPKEAPYMPPDLQANILAAIQAINAGADKDKVFQRLSAQYPNEASMIKTILYPKTPSDAIEMLKIIYNRQ